MVGLYQKGEQIGERIRVGEVERKLVHSGFALTEGALPARGGGGEERFREEVVRGDRELLKGVENCGIGERGARGRELGGGFGGVGAGGDKRDGGSGRG
jgi:hypothetical protein